MEKHAFVIYIVQEFRVNYEAEEPFLELNVYYNSFKEKDVSSIIYIFFEVIM